MSKVADSEKGDESYPLKQISKDDEKNSSKKSLTKDGKDQDPATEKLVKEENNDKQATSSLKNRLTSSKYLTNTKVKSALLCLVILLVLVALVVIIVVLNMSASDDWEEANIPRLMRIIPTPNSHKNLVRFKRSSSRSDSNWPPLVKQMDQFLDKYNFTNLVIQEKNVSTCTEKGPEKHEFCHYNIDLVLNNCKPEEKYGYPEGVPCLFLVLNKILNWIPEKYSPEELKDEKIPDNVKSKLETGDLVITCQGRTPFDKENLGKISYYPSQKIEPIYFPYKGHPDYLAPFVALKFESPQPNIALAVECRLWAKNLNKTSTPSPILPFHILID